MLVSATCVTRHANINEYTVLLWPWRSSSEKASFNAPPVDSPSNLLQVCPESLPVFGIPFLQYVGREFNLILSDVED